jgi:Rhs element Vgr protein
MASVTVTILCNGKKLDPKQQIVAVDVMHEANRIPDARLVLIDGEPSKQKFELADSDFFQPGGELEIKLRYETEPSKDFTVYKGILIKQQLHANEEGFLLTVESKHKAIALTTPRKNAVFAGKSDNEIISSLLKEAGLKGKGSMDVSYKHKQIVQYASSNWDFIVSRAEANGGVLIPGIQDVIVKSIKPLESQAKKQKIIFGIDEIYSFELEASAEDQLPEVNGTAWSVKDQSLLPPKVSASFDPGLGNLKGGDLSKKIDAAAYQMINAVEMDKQEVEAWVNARLTKSRMAMFRGRIRMKGRGDLVAGDSIEIEGLGKRFKGKALISAIRHQVDDQGWTTDLQLGLSSAWFYENDNVSEKPAMGLLPAIQGLQIGVIEKFEEDPDKNFRARVKVPAFKSKKEGVVWARLASMYAGKERGLFFFPEEGDEVVIGFLNDDPRQAIVLGSLFSASNMIPKGFKSTKDNFDKGIVLKNGTRISLKDDKKSIIEFETPGKNKITMDDSKKSIVMFDAQKNTIELSDKGITIKSAKDLVIEASGNVTIKGSKVDVK